MTTRPMRLIVPVLLGLLPVLARNPRSLVVLAVLPAILLGVVTLLTRRAIDDPANNAGFGAALVLGALMIALSLLAALTIARAIGLYLQTRGWRRAGVLWLDALGIFLAAAILLTPHLYRKHVTLRPPPPSCTEIPVRIAGEEFHLKLASSTTIYPDDPRQAAYLGTPRHQRRVCRTTRNGERPMIASAIGIRSGEYNICRTPSQLAFERFGCAEDRWTRGKMILYDPATVDRGFFNLDRAHPEDSWRQGTARCRPNSGPTLECSAILTISQNLRVFWIFRAAPGGEAEAYTASRKAVMETVTQLAG